MTTIPLRRRLAVGVIATALALTAACSDDGDDTADGSDDQATTTAAGEPGTETSGEPATPSPTAGPPYVVELSGAGEVPGPGADGAGGSLQVTFDPAGEVCVNGQVTGLGPITSAFVGSGGDTEATTEADLRIDLGVTTTGGDTQTIATCTAADVDDIDNIAGELEEDPGDYFVSVATDDFPDGAARGQLAAG